MAPNAWNKLPGTNRKAVYNKYKLNKQPKT